MKTQCQKHLQKHLQEHLQKLLHRRQLLYIQVTQDLSITFFVFKNSSSFVSKVVREVHLIKNGQKHRNVCRRGRDDVSRLLKALHIATPVFEYASELSSMQVPNSQSSQRGEGRGERGGRGGRRRRGGDDDGGGGEGSEGQISGVPDAYMTTFQM